MPPTIMSMICVIDNVELAGISTIGEAETVLQYTVDDTIQTSGISNNNFKFFTLSLPLLVRILKWYPLLWHVPLMSGILRLVFFVVSFYFIISLSESVLLNASLIAMLNNSVRKAPAVMPGLFSCPNLTK